MGVGDEAYFAADLYQGTAEYYDLYRLPYPTSLLAHLVAGTHLSGRGRLLDLACGTGQLAFPLSPHFAQVWAVDQEPGMIETVRVKASAAGTRDLRPVVSSAEALDAPADHFELAVVGNAFHRLDRDLVARQIFRWLAPGGHLALCWSSSPWVGEEDWQRSLAATLERWQRKLGAEHRIPAGADRTRRDRPDPEVLSTAGFELAGRHAFTAEHRWSLPELAGHIHSTSFLPPAVLGDQAAAFDADLTATLSPHDNGGVFTETVSFAYDLARKPAASTPPDPRLAVAADLPAIKALIDAAYAKYLPRMEKPPAPLFRDYGPSVAQGTTWVVGSPITALITLYPRADHLYVENVVVDPGAQGRGLGRALMDFAEQEAARRGLHRMALVTHEAMTENQAIYARLGYVEVERRTEDGYRRIYLEKQLNG